MSPPTIAALPLTFGSLFAGIGGFDLGFERAGLTCRWQVEIDPFARAVLAKHWPTVTRYEDIRTFDARDAEPVDVVCGGFPCQPHSLAGKRQASADDRDLWGQFARVIRHARPRWVVAENVPGLLSSETGRFFGRVLGDLAACGYDAEWDCLPAAAVGAPHRRDRVWLVAYPRRRRWGTGSAVRPRAGRPLSQSPGPSQDVADALHDGREERALPEGQARETLSDALGSRGTRAHVGHADRSGLSEPRHPGAARQSQGYIFAGAAVDRAGWWAVEPELGRLAHGVPDRVHRLRGLGNAIVPQIAEWIGRRLIAAGSVLEGAHA